MSDTPDIAIEVEDVFLSYRPYLDRKPTLRKRFTGARQRTRGEVIALHDVSFQVERGQAFGIVGTNGSGKSTLLRVLAGTLPPDSGQVTRRGRTSTLLQLGVGFNPQLSGRRNIVLGGVAAGRSRQDMLEATDAIIDYAELGEAIDRPMATYSSGMFSRLAFAVAIKQEPSILLLDEIFAVGDASFRQKSVESMRDLLDDAGTIVIVSHSLNILREFCDQALWLDRGTVRSIGPAEAVVAEYESEATAARKKKKSRAGGRLAGQQSNRGNILVAGGPETTPLFERVRSSLAAEGSDYLAVRNVRPQLQLASLAKYAPQQRVLAHVAASQYPEVAHEVTRWARKLVALRDPRDHLVLDLAARAAGAQRDAPTREAGELLWKAVAEKAADPTSRTLEQLYAYARDLGLADDETSTGWRTQVATIREIDPSKDLFVWRTGQGDEAGLASFLQVELVAPPMPESSALWPRWLSRPDVDAVRAELDPVVEQFGFGSDWDLAPGEAIDEALLRTEAETLLPAVAVEGDDEGIPEWRSGAVNGNPQHMVKLAEALEATDPAEAVVWLERGSYLGNRVAMYRLGRMLLEGNVPTDRDRAWFWLRESTRLGYKPAAPVVARLRRGDA